MTAVLPPSYGFRPRRLLATLLLTTALLTPQAGRAQSDPSTPALTVVPSAAPSQMVPVPALTVIPPDNVVPSTAAATTVPTAPIAAVIPTAAPTSRVAASSPGGVAPTNVTQATTHPASPLPTGTPSLALAKTPAISAPVPNAPSVAASVASTSAAATSAAMPVPMPVSAGSTAKATVPAPSQTIAVVPSAQNAAMPPALTPDQSVANKLAPANPAGPIVNAKQDAAGLPAGPDMSPIGAASGIANNATKTGPQVAGPSGPDDYYDAGGMTPGSPLVKGQGPRKINPADEPAQKYIVAEKEHGTNSREAELAAGRRALEAEQYATAAEIYDRLYERYPKDENVLMGRAIAYQHTGEPRKAAKMYDNMLDIDPQNLDAEVNILGLMGKEYPDVALRKLMELREKHPADPMIVAQIGVTEGRQGQYDDAIKNLQIAADLEPTNAQHRFNLGIVADKAGRKDDAMKYYQDALDTDANDTSTDKPSIPRDKIQDRLVALRQQ